MISDFRKIDSNIQLKNNSLESQNKSIRDKLDIQIKQTPIDISGLFKPHIDAVSDCWQFIKQSENKINTIDSYCAKMKKNKMPQYDGSKLKKSEDEKSKAITELENIKSEYIRLWRLVSNISKDRQKIESYKVSVI